MFYRMQTDLGYNWTDPKLNTNILNELKISVIEKMVVYVNRTGQTIWALSRIIDFHDYFLKYTKRPKKSRKTHESDGQLNWGRNKPKVSHIINAIRGRLNKFRNLLKSSASNMMLYSIVLFCFDGVVIAAQCTETFFISVVLPRI